MYTILKLFRPLEGNHEAGGAPGENESDTLPYQLDSRVGMQAYKFC